MSDAEDWQFRGATEEKKLSGVMGFQVLITLEKLFQAATKRQGNRSVSVRGPLAIKPCTLQRSRRLLRIFKRYTRKQASNK